MRLIIFIGEVLYQSLFSPFFPCVGSTIGEQISILREKKKKKKLRFCLFSLWMRFHFGVLALVQDF